MIPIALLALVTTACTQLDDLRTNPAGATPGTTPDVGIPTIPEGGLPTMPAPPTEDSAAGQVAESARSQLADRLSVDPAAIDVLKAEHVTWPDTSLGCPEPGQMYAQMLVEGYRVVLDHDSRVWVYHAGSDRQPFLCPSDERDGGYDFVPPPGFDT